MILQHLPSNLIKVLDTDSLMLIKTAAKGIVQKTRATIDSWVCFSALKLEKTVHLFLAPFLCQN